MTSRSSHEVLDWLKRELALAVVRRFTADEIRSRSLENLRRWKQQGTWCAAYDEWQEILEGKDDAALLASMLGLDERAERLRQSPPYVGLLSNAEVASLNEEAAERLRHS